MSLETLNERLTKGEQLVILEELVLDVTHFKGSHPGGEKVFTSSLGRDVSKFFYGGYSLASQTYPWVHSPSAMLRAHPIKVGAL